VTTTVTLPAPPAPYLEAGQRNRVVGVGSAFGRLAATKALKHAESDISDAVVFVMRIAARGTAHVHNYASLWLQVIPTTAAVFTTVGALIALYVALTGTGRGTPHQALSGGTGTPRARQTPKGWH